MTAVVSSPPAVLAAVVAETSFPLMNDSTRSNLLLFVVAVQEALAVANSGRFFSPAPNGSGYFRRERTICCNSYDDCGEDRNVTQASWSLTSAYPVVLQVRPLRPSATANSLLMTRQLLLMMLVVQCRTSIPILPFRRRRRRQWRRKFMCACVC